MIDTTLSEQFQKSKGQPVLVGDDEVHPIYALELDKERLIKLKWISTQSNFKQGLQIKIDKGFIEVNGEKFTNIILWEDTCPCEVLLRCVPQKKAKFKLWNVWDVDGLTQAWVGNAGIAISELDNYICLRCSDGSGDINLKNTVVELMVG